MALHHPPKIYTLLVEDQGAKVWDDEGQLLGFLPDLAFGSPVRIIWGEALKDYIPKGSRVQIIVAKSNLETKCQPTPALNAKERREVHRRFLKIDETQDPINSAHAFDNDPVADGRHQFWIAWHPKKDILDWIDAVSYAGATVVLATTWHRAVLAALEGRQPVQFFLGIDKDIARLLLFHGREILIQRAVHLPEGLEPNALSEEGREQITEVIAEEITRTFQYVKQKFRHINVNELYVAGFYQVPRELVERLGRSRVTIHSLNASVPQFLIKGMRSEREHAHPLNLVPIEIQDAMRFRLIRVGVWATAVTLICGLGLAYAGLKHNERNLQMLLNSEKINRDLRKNTIEEADQAGKFRLGVNRLRRAETRQKASIESLAGLGATLFRVPEGVLIEKIDIIQIPCERVSFRFAISGLALSGNRFSVGPLADYLDRLSKFRISLDPVQEVDIADRPLMAGGSNEMAVTRFKITGVSQ